MKNPTKESPETSLILRDYGQLRVWTANEIDSLTAAALDSTSQIDVVDTPETQAAAVAGQQQIVSIIRRIKRDHDMVKAPVLNLCREIDRIAKEASAELEAENVRIGGLVIEYQESEREKARAAERLRLAELARLEAERLAEQRKLEAERVAEQRRLQHELEQKMAAEGDAKRRAEMEAQAARQAQLVDVAAAETAKRQQEFSLQAAEALGPPVVAPKADGQSVRPDWDWEVTDLHALYRTNPGLVELTPRRREIRECIAILATGETAPNIPGLRVWRVIKTSVRTGPSKTIDV